MTSEETEIWKWLRIMRPSMRPPRPMTMSRSACTLKSIAQPMVTVRGSTSRRRSFLRARLRSP